MKNVACVPVPEITGGGYHRPWKANHSKKSPMPFVSEQGDDRENSTTICKLTPALRKYSPMGLWVKLH